MAKVNRAAEVKKFTDIPNVGKAMERDFLFLGVTSPVQLKKLDAYTLYQKMCKKSGTRQDPCVLDTYLAVIDFMNGGPAKPWFYYTKDRKKRFPNV
ncbi:MAG: helix-hairpin-helix domain-containing protein [Patescibacteria group bacterium]